MQNTPWSSSISACAYITLTETLSSTPSLLDSTLLRAQLFLASDLAPWLLLPRRHIRCCAHARGTQDPLCAPLHLRFNEGAGRTSYKELQRASFSQPRRSTAHSGAQKQVPRPRSPVSESTWPRVERQRTRSSRISWLGHSAP